MVTLYHCGWSILAEHCRAMGKRHMSSWIWPNFLRKYIFLKKLQIFFCIISENLEKHIQKFPPKSRDLLKESWQHLKALRAFFPSGAERNWRACSSARHGGRGKRYKNIPTELSKVCACIPPKWRSNDLSKSHRQLLVKEFQLRLVSGPRSAPSPSPRTFPFSPERSFRAFGPI